MSSELAERRKGSRPTTADSDVPSLAVVGACYYLPAERFARFARKFVTQMGSGVNVKGFDLVSIDHPLARSTGSERWRQTQGPYYDVSAYATGADAAPSGDLCLFFNDTLFIKHPWRQMAKRFSSFMRGVAAVEVPGALGAVHPTTDTLTKDTRSSQHRHLSTFCFLLNRPGLAILKELAAELPDGSPDGSREWLEGYASSDRALELLLHFHLTGPETPWTWRSQGALTDQDDLVLRKAVTVTFEYLFTERLLRVGGFILPVNLGLGYRIAARAARLSRRFRY